MMSGRTERDQVRLFYDQQSRQDPRHAGVLGEPNDFASSYREYQELRSFRQLVSLPPSSRVIEFGCGGGRWLAELAPQVKQCVGVELSAGCLETCQQRLSGFQNVTIHQAALQDFVLRDPFDLLYYSGVLLYLSDEEIDAALTNHVQHLAPGGTVLVRDSVARDQTHQLQHPQGYSAIYRTLALWDAIMDRQGLRRTGRQIANARPLSEAGRQGTWLVRAHRLARWLGMEMAMLQAAAMVFGHRPDDRDAYSHEFLVYRRRKAAGVRPSLARNPAQD